MPKNYKKLYTGILIAICFSAFLLFFRSPAREIKNIQKEGTPAFTSATFPAPTTPEKETATKKTALEEVVVLSKNTETVTVIAGQDKITLSVAPDTTFYNALVDARSTEKISFSGKNYPGLGFFVTDIQNLHSGEGLDLLYYVNGKEATVGVSQYVLKNGDVLEWKLE